MFCAFTFTAFVSVALVLLPMTSVEISLGTLTFPAITRVSFVETGLNTLQTPEMIQTIIKAFQKDGRRFEIMRSADMRLSILTETALEIIDNNVIPIGEEIKGKK